MITDKPTTLTKGKGFIKRQESSLGFAQLSKVATNKAISENENVDQIICTKTYFFEIK